VSARAHQPVAVISGGNGGLGRALAAGLRAQGWRLHLIDRHFDAAQDAPDQQLHRCDLTDAAAREACFARILARDPRLDLVIYNAGITQIGPVEALAEATHRQVFEVNYFAACAMARAFLPTLRQSRGTHLAISSVAGFAPLYQRAAYAGSKHALDGFFKCLRAEEARHGVRVQIAAPSFIATNPGRPETTAEGIARPGSAPDGVDYMSPEAAAAQILRGLARGHAMIPVGRVARLAWWLNRAAPGLMHRAMMRSVARSRTC
jgi:NAD(P)-dependent dehydrogenase (short-subunit alcohol dehydrogenase family)